MMFQTPTVASAVLSSTPRSSLDRSAALRRGTNRYATGAPSYKHTEPHRTRERDALSARRSDRFGIGNTVSRIGIIPRNVMQGQPSMGKPVVPLLPGLNAGVSAAACG